MILHYNPECFLENVSHRAKRHIEIAPQTRSEMQVSNFHLYYSLETPSRTTIKPKTCLEIATC